MKLLAPLLGSLALLLLLSSAPASADGTANIPWGLWDATVIVEQVEVPFRLELRLAKGGIRGAFFNGEERVHATSGSLEGDTLTLKFDHYATRLVARWSEGELTGSYERAGKSAYPFRAKPFVPLPAKKKSPAPSIAGTWDVRVQSAKGEAAWTLFVRQSGSAISGAILRVDGDTGVLSGQYADGKFVLSHFSGARPSLFELTLEPGGALTIVQDKKNTYSAVRSTEARKQNLPSPPDPSRWTSVVDPTQPLRFTAKDLAGNAVTEADARFRGKVVLLNIMGSWCPNCHDEAPFLVALSHKYRKRGLEVVSISFEDAQQLVDPARLRAFIENYGVDYTVLLGGEPRELHDKLPGSVNLNTWPATFFIGRDGLVRGVHAGFAGKATGAAHERLKTEITATVERLLRERAGT